FSGKNEWRTRISAARALLSRNREYCAGSFAGDAAVDQQCRAGVSNFGGGRWGSPLRRRLSCTAPLCPAGPSAPAAPTLRPERKSHGRCALLWAARCSRALRGLASVTHGRRDV